MVLASGARGHWFVSCPDLIRLPCIYSFDSLLRTLPVRNPTCFNYCLMTAVTLRTKRILPGNCYLLLASLSKFEVILRTKRILSAYYWYCSIILKLQTYGPTRVAGDCEFENWLRRNFFPAYFRISPLLEHVRKVVGDFERKFVFSTGVR